MAQYDDSRNPSSSNPDRAEARSPWAEPSPPTEPGGLQLPGEAEGAWGNGGQRPSADARRRNQWRQFKHLTPNFGPSPTAEPEPEPKPLTPPDAPDPPELFRPASARNASLPAFKRPLSPPPQAPPAVARPSAAIRPPAVPRPSAALRPPAMPRPPVAPRPETGRSGGLQIHPHSFQPSRPVPGAASPGVKDLPAKDLPTNVTPLRPLPRRSPPASPAQTARSLVPPPSGARPLVPAEPPSSPRRSRAAGAKRRLANPPLPLLYLIRLVILGVGVAAIAGTLLSVLSPTNLASAPEGATAAGSPSGGRSARGGLVQGGTATTITDLRLTSEIARLTGEMEQLGTLTPGLTPVAFAVDLDSGQYVDLGGAETVAAASTIKVPLLVAFLQQVDAGTMALNQALVMREEDIAGGSGTMRSATVGTEYTALEVATRMIVASDNTATNMMIAALGGIEPLNQAFIAWGLGQTLLRNPLPDLEGTNVTSAKDLALLMALIDQGGLLSTRSRDRLFSIMQRTENGSLIPAGVNDRSLTANKTGDIGSMLGDVALVDVPNGKRYALAVLVQRPHNDGRAGELIRRMTETVHSELAQPMAPAGNPNAAPPARLSPMGEPGEFEAPSDPQDSGGESPPIAPPGRAPARDEVPPG